MGTYDRQIYLPAVLETGWGTNVNANFSRLADLAYNVKAYGAACDGVTDDTTAVQAAIDALPAVTYSGEHPITGGGMVLIPGPTKVSALHIYDLTRLVGVGINGAKLLVTGGGITVSKVGGQNYARSFAIENLRIEASGTPTYGLNLKDVVYYTLRNLDVKGVFSGASIWLNGGFGSHWDRVYVNSNTANIGLLMDPTGSTAGGINSHIFNACNFRTCSTGIKDTATSTTAAPSGDSITFQGCIIESNTSIGYDAYAVRNRTFQGCHFEGNTTYHLRTNILNTHYCTNLHFNNCSFANWKIYLDGDHDTVFDGLAGGNNTPTGLGRITCTANSQAPLFRSVLRIHNFDDNDNGAVNFASGGTWPIIEQPLASLALTDGATVETPIRRGNYFTLSAGGSRTIAAPGTAASANVKYFEDDVRNAPRGWQISYDILNNTGGAITTTWNAAFKLAGAWVDPATTKRRTISFRYDGTNWIEQGRAAADI